MKYLPALFSLILTLNGAWASPLTTEELNSLYKQKTVEHVIVERYLDSSQGPATVLGYHFDYYLNDNLYYALAIFGAIEGNRGGYGIAALGLGGSYELTRDLLFDGKLLIGSGGGGGVPAGGGLAVEYQAGLSYQILKNIFIEGKYGQLSFPSGSMSCPIFGIGVGFRYNLIKLPYNTVARNP